MNTQNNTPETTQTANKPPESPTKESIKISEETGSSIAVIVDHLSQGFLKNKKADIEFHLAIFNRTFKLIGFIIFSIFTFSGVLMFGFEQKYFDSGFSLLTHTLAIVAGAIAVASSFRPPSE